MVILVLLITLIHSVLGWTTKSGFTHKCVHDLLVQNHTAHTQHVQYSATRMDNPDHEAVPPQRRLQEAVAYPRYENEVTDFIRITPYWTDLEADLNVFGKESFLGFIQEILSAAIHYFQSKLKVKRVQGNLKLHRDCHWKFDNEEGGVMACINFTELSCFTARVPESHFADDYELHPSTGSFEKLHIGGEGIPNTDLVLYVTAQNSLCESSFAWAAPCVRDQDGRPVAGVINFCPNSLADESVLDWRVGVDVCIHEMTHILAMNNDNFNNFLFESDDNTTSGIFRVTDEGLTTIVTPNVMQFMHQHFDCPAWIDSESGVELGAPLEGGPDLTDTSSHWDERYFFSEIMTSISYADSMYVSPLTFSLFVDSGWYFIDDIEDSSEWFTFGKDRGCQFLSEPCIDPSSDQTQWPEFWCDQTRQNELKTGCTYDGLGKAECILFDYASALPSQYRYFTDSHQGGSQNADYCPAMDALNYPTNKVYPYLCAETSPTRLATLQSEELYFETHGDSGSRCIEAQVSGIDTSQFNGYCLRVECQGWDTASQQWSSLTISLSDGSSVQCSRDDLRPRLLKILFSQNSTMITVRCPTIDQYCPNGLTQPTSCFDGRWSESSQSCVCSPGYTGAKCEQTLRQPIIESSVLAGPVVQTLPQTPCKLITGYDTYMGVAVFVRRNVLFEGVYVFEGTSFDGPGFTVKAHCTCYACIDSQNPVDCQEWYLWDVVTKDYRLVEGYRMSDCTTSRSCAAEEFGECDTLTRLPTASPTRVPTNKPVSAAPPPTFQPTPLPTAKPTEGAANPPTLPTVTIDRVTTSLAAEKKFGAWMPSLMLTVILAAQ